MFVFTFRARAQTADLGGSIDPSFAEAGRGFQVAPLDGVIPWRAVLDRNLQLVFTDSDGCGGGQA